MTSESNLPSASTPTASSVPPDRLAGLTIDTVRTLVIDAVERAKSGHPGAPMGLAPLAYALWTRVLKYDGARPDWADRDRLVLSCGHASMLLYAMLYLTGQDLTLDDLRSFRQWGSKAAGHPEHELVGGVEITTGPLGQGFSSAVGMALAERMLAARFNRPGHEIVDHRTYVIASDGDLMEGVSQEAASLAGHLGLGRLCAFYDANQVTIDGATDLSFTEDVGARFEACGWQVLRVDDQATTDDYARAAEVARADESRPTLVICRTHIGWGSPNKQDSSSSHGAPLGEDEVRLTKRNLGWPEDATFLVPDEVYEHMQEVGARGAPAALAWDRMFEEYRSAFPTEAAAFERTLRGKLPANWAEALPSFEPGTAMATRKASGMVLNAIQDAVPELVGGSADLAGSNKTELKGEGLVTRDDYSGRNFHYGVREHGMAAVMNGLALHGGLLPFGGTFLVFSDYLRPSIRLAALMKLRVIYVFTHDSIGVGEDGPTHQPVEHLAALRAFPGLRVFRPADGAETAEAWRAALEAEGPSAIVLSRQKVPEFPHGDGHYAPAAGLAEGAYVLTGASSQPDVTLLASGSEVGLAVEAARRLEEADGLAVRVVSMPCWKLFEAQDPSVREEVLGAGAVRVGVEAAASFGWHRWIGPGGGLVTLDRFGASAPGDRLMAEFGFTPENVASVAREAVARARQAD